MHDVHDSKASFKGFLTWWWGHMSFPWVWLSLIIHNFMWLCVLCFPDHDNTSVSLIRIMKKWEANHINDFDLWHDKIQGYFLQNVFLHCVWSFYENHKAQKTNFRWGFHRQGHKFTLRKVRKEAMRQVQQYSKAVRWCVNLSAHII